MKTKYMYISFSIITAPGNKLFYQCTNNKNFHVIGTVEWYPRFTSYCYYPITGTVYSIECLNDIAHFISQLNKQ